MDQETKLQEKWYFKTYWLIIALLCVGPFALPLAWFNPRYTRQKKIIITLVVLVLTYLSVVSTVKSLKLIVQRYQEIEQQMQ